MLQVCKKQANTPYYIHAIEKNVYSLEEINYFICNHMNLVYREFFSDSLYDYIENELGENAVAERLRALDQGDASVRDLIMCMLKSSGYYTAEDLGPVAELLININNLSRNERMLIEAENMMKFKHYGTALHICLDILGSRDAADKSNDRFFAGIAFQTGVIYARLFMCRPANAYFDMAYELYEDPAYAKASVYMSLISNDEEELLRTIIKYKVSDEALAAIKQRITKIAEQISGCGEYAAFEEEIISEGGAEKQIAKWKNEYYTMLS